MSRSTWRSSLISAKEPLLHAGISTVMTSSGRAGSTRQAASFSRCCRTCRDPVEIRLKSRSIRFRRWPYPGFGKNSPSLSALNTGNTIKQSLIAPSHWNWMP